MSSSGLDHIGLSVGDLDAAIAFYASALGFAPEFRFELPHGIRGLMTIDGSGARLELFEHPGSRPGVHAVAPLDALATRGYGHFALCTAQLGAVFEQALSAGAQPLMAPGPSPEPGVRMAFLADPEGNLIELLQRG